MTTTLLPAAAASLDLPKVAGTVWSLVLDEGYDGVAQYGHYASEELAKQAQEAVAAALDEQHPEVDGFKRSSQLRIFPLQVLAEPPELQKYTATVDLVTGKEEVAPSHVVSIEPRVTPWHVLDVPVSYPTAHLVHVVASGPTPQSAMHRARTVYQRAVDAGVPAFVSRIQAVTNQVAAQTEAIANEEGWHDHRDRLEAAMLAEFGPDPYTDEQLVHWHSLRFGL